VPKRKTSRSLADRLRPAPQVDHVRHLSALPEVGAAGAVLVATGVLASRRLSSIEEQVFHAVGAPPNKVDAVLWLPMQFGSALAAPAVAFASWSAWRRWRPSVGALAIGLGAWEAAKLVKSVVERGRPAAVIPGYVARPGAPRDGLGFVSGHSTVAFSLAAVTAPYLPRSGRVAVYGLAGVVGLARIHVGAHLPLDVVGGAALGSLMGWSWNLAVGVPVVVGGRRS
jgi:membrane-associated phospholipid phosphatase